MALMPAGLARASATTACVASFRFVHQFSGSCSAQPVFTDVMAISRLGKKALAATSPVWVFTRLALMDELPMSSPKVNILMC